MDAHIEELFEAAPTFEEGGLALHPDYMRCAEITYDLESMIDSCFGQEVVQLMEEYKRAMYMTQQIQCLHYFHQGYLAAKAERSRP